MAAARKKAPAKKRSTKSAAAQPVKITKPKNGSQYNQSELFECIQTACNLETKKQAKEVYESFAGMLQIALKKGYKVPLPGIGKILVRKSKARMGRNPATGEAIKIPARKRVRLTPSKVLKEAVL